MTHSGPEASSPSWVTDRLTELRPTPSRNGVGPGEREMVEILKAATTVPDHGGLKPWRFAVVKDAGRERFADALVAGLHHERGSDLLDSVVNKMREKAFAAPCCVMVISSPVSGSNVPEWEQLVSASCTGYAMVLAATFLGFGAIWKSASVLHTPPVRSLFGATDREQLLGWVNIGTPEDVGDRYTRDRTDPELSALVTVIDGGGTRPLPQ
jgi:nitroreductase